MNPEYNGIGNIFPRQVADSLWILGNESFHLYLVRGKNACALVETGISATTEILQNQLSLIGAKPDYLIVTHPHSDHITGLDYLKKLFPQATVIAGEGAESFISHPKAEQSMIAEDLHMMEAMASRGLCSHRPAIVSPPLLSGCKVVNDSEELNLGDLTIRFLEAKGHSPGNIIVYIPDRKTILVSDSFGNYYPKIGFFPTFFTGFAAYMNTIDRLEKFNPMIIGLAHNGLFSGNEAIRDVFQKARIAAMDVRNYIIVNKRDDEKIANDLFEFFYTDELKIYSPQNILNCCRLLVRRVREL